MAQSITKTFTASDAGMTGSAHVVWVRDVIEDGETVSYYGINAVNYPGTNTSVFDISAIPKGSTINSAKFTSSTNRNTTASFWGCGMAKYIGSSQTEFNNTNVRNWLRNQSEFTDISCRCVQTIPLSSSSGIYEARKNSSAGSWTISPYSKVVSLKLEINYTPPDEDGTVDFGTGGTWKACKICFAINGTWQKVKAYFGTGGSWKQVK